MITFAANPLAELRTYLSDQTVGADQAMPRHDSGGRERDRIEHAGAAPLTPGGDLRDHAAPDADYVAVDPSTYRDFFAGEEEQLRNVVRGDLAAGYGVVCAKGTTLVLARVDSTQQLTPELQRGSPASAADRRARGTRSIARRGQLGPATVDHLEVEPHAARLAPADQRRDPKAARQQRACT